MQRQHAPRLRTRLHGWRASGWGLVALGVLVLLAVCAPLSPYDPLAQSFAQLQPPSFAHPFGTDELGRDVVTRVVFGLRLTLLTAVGSAALAGLVGIALGLVAGYLGGVLDIVVMRLVDVVLAFPATLLAVVLVAVLGGGVLPLVVAISLVGIPPFARLTRASVMSIKEREFVDAQRAAGANGADIMVRTVLPNSVGSAGVQFVVTASIAVLTESGLSFLGLGAPAPTPTLGAMLFQGQLNLFYAPWYSVLVGLSIVLVVASLDGLGASLQRRFGGSGRGAVVA